VLTVEERQAIAARLERYLKSFRGSGRPSPRALAAGARTTTGCQAVDGRGPADLTDGDSWKSPALVEHFCWRSRSAEADNCRKSCGPHSAGRLSEKRRAQLWQQLQQNLRSSSSRPTSIRRASAGRVLEIWSAGIRTPPHHAAVEDVLAEVAATWQDGKACASECSRNTSTSWPTAAAGRSGKSLAAEVARAVWNLLGATNSRSSSMPGHVSTAQGSEVRSCPKGKAWLLGVRDRLWPSPCRGA